MLESKTMREFPMARVEVMKPLISRQRFRSAEEDAMMKEVQATHAPDGNEVDIRPLLHVVEGILQSTIIPNPDNAQRQALPTDALEEKSREAGCIDTLKAMAYSMHCLARISGNALDDIDTNMYRTPLPLLKMLSSYSWEAKVVLVLAAFALNYGEFWSRPLLYHTNFLTASTADSEKVPEILEPRETLRPHFVALNDVVKAMLSLTKCIVEFAQLPSDMSMAAHYFPNAAYWTIRSVMVCTSTVSYLGCLREEYTSSSVADVWMLSTFAHKIKQIQDHLAKELALCYQYTGNASCKADS